MEDHLIAAVQAAYTHSAESSAALQWLQGFQAAPEAWQASPLIVDAHGLFKG